MRDKLVKQVRDDKERHEYILMTDTENYLDPNFEVIGGIHHLSSKEKVSSIYNTSVVDGKSLQDNLGKTSKEREIQNQAFEQFQEQCCLCFQILREHAYVFINLL